MQTQSYGGRVLEIAENEAELRAVYDAPSDLVRRKCLPRLDAHCREFIARAPFLCISTAAADGSADVSPRGDAPGFVRVLDDERLLIPDRPGNNRIDSLINLLQCPHVGLLFLVPGIDETLRVNGLGRVVLQCDLLAECSVNGKPPRSGILVEVREAFLQCAKALRRSRLWSPDSQLSRESLPTLGQMLVDQTGCPTSVADLDALIEKAYREKLY